MTWDVTCVDTFADTVLVQSALAPGAAARQAEERKRRRYAELSQPYIFEPIALETSGVYGPAAAAFDTLLTLRLVKLLYYAYIVSSEPPVALVVRL